jgi:hypothetical protein
VTASVAQPEPRAAWRITVSVETLAYLVVFLVALGLRWVRLGAAPLGPSEARQAMAAWNLLSADAYGARAVESPLTFAGLVIGLAVASPTNAAARFASMLGGLALVFTPLLFRGRLGRLPTLIAVCLLALSPGAVVAARQVGGTGFAMLGLVLMLAAFERYLSTDRRGMLTLAGVALGVALLADFGTPVALLTMLLGAGFMLLTDEEGTFTPELVRERLGEVPWRVFLIGLLATLGLLSTLFFLAPDGLGALADQLGRLVTGLARRPQGAAYVGVALGIYEPVLLIFGLIGAWLASQSPDPWPRFVAGWGVAALLVGLIYPGALPAHALWSVVPLATLAGPVVGSLLDREEDDDAPRWGVWAHGAGVVALFGMIFASLSRYLQSPRLLNFRPRFEIQTAGDIPLDLILLVLWVVLLVIVWMTAASMWGPRAAWRGAGLGLLALGLMAAAGQSASLALTHPSSPYEALNVSPAQPALDILVDTAGEIGKLAAGHPHDASVSVQADPDGALAWALRDFTNLTFVARADPTVESVMVITPADGADPALGSSYVGQDFVIVRTWTPGGLSVKDFIRWTLYRTAGTLPYEERVILWVREDVYRIAPATGVPEG